MTIPKSYSPRDSNLKSSPNRLRVEVYVYKHMLIPQLNDPPYIERFASLSESYIKDNPAYFP